MLGSAGIIQEVAQALAGLSAPVVLDPVMVAKGGDRLLASEAVAALRQTLLPMATLLTPNLPEAAELLGEVEAADLVMMQAQATRLLSLGPKAVLLKGGHLGGEGSPDLLASAAGVQRLDSVRFKTRNTHGTGCSLASALAAELGHGRSVAEAAERAKVWLSEAIATADQIGAGSGHGPVHHFWQWMTASWSAPLGPEFETARN
jgi:hydroxymethylpyrimidine/phosphomethylpyrimidine kinase